MFLLLTTIKATVAESRMTTTMGISRKVTQQETMINLRSQLDRLMTYASGDVYAVKRGEEP
jgi:hypothetical protein